MNYAILGLAGFLTWLSLKRKMLLLSVATFLTWWALALWFFFTPTPVLGISLDYQQILSYVFVLLSFIPLLALMDTEIRKQSKDGKSWTEWGSRPEEPKESGYDTYRKQLEGKINRRLR